MRRKWRNCKKTVQSLRDEMDEIRLEHRDERQAMERAHRDELDELRTTIRQLRDRLEEAENV